MNYRVHMRAYTLKNDGVETSEASIVCQSYEHAAEVVRVAMHNDMNPLRKFWRLNYCSAEYWLSPV